MLRLERPEALYLLLILLPLAGLFIWYMLGRKAAMERFGEKSLTARLMPDRPTAKHVVKFSLLALSFIALIFALANPQIGQRTELVQREGLDLFVALDISNSMLAEGERGPDRLARAKQMLSRMSEKLAGDRVGLIIFAGYSYLQLPLTTDYAAFKGILRTITPSLAGTQGTDIGAAIEMAEAAFERSGSEHKAMLIISDGENHEEGTMEAARAAAEAGTTIYTVGVGSTRGAPVPDFFNGRQRGYKQNNEGSTVLSRLNPQMLQEVAQAGGGTYFQLESSASTVTSLRNELAALEKTQYETQEFTDYEDQYQWFLALAMFLLVLEYFLSEKRTPLLSRIEAFR